MNQKMKELLHEFVERDFSIRKMLDVLDALHEIELDMRILTIHREWKKFELEFSDKSNLKMNVYELEGVLKRYALEYDAKELLDREVLKELEDEL